MASDISALVEHFFRHEYGRLVAMLTKSLGIRQLHLIEDVVQAALSKALHTWARSGVPKNPSAWLFRTSKNLAIDFFRRRNLESRTLALLGEDLRTASVDCGSTMSIEETEPGDETLRLLYLCCHSSISMESRVALALKIVGGFSVDEIANALLISKSSAEKRLTRARIALSERGTEISELTAESVRERVESVLSTIYLIFTEGHASTVGDQSFRTELSNEAIRLARMTNEHAWSRSPSTAALLGLLLLQSSRMDARVDTHGCIVLLGDQDRSRWDSTRIREAMHWMTLAAEGSELSRYHVEAAIAWEHARASCIESVDWNRVTRLYEMLAVIHPGPMIRLNLVIARSRVDGAAAGLKALAAIPDTDRIRLRPWWDCAIADAYERLNRPAEAIAHLTDALALSMNAAQKTLIERKRNCLFGNPHERSLRTD